MSQTLVSAVSRAQSTSAERQAFRHWTANLAALAQSQPRIVEAAGNLPDPMEWVYARDGALTALMAGGKWWGGCSLPRRAAEFMFRAAELTGTVICFLNPIHAAQLRVALDRMHAGQALLALTPTVQAMRMILASADFSGEIAHRRLYFAWGEYWEAELDRILTEHPGLPMPTQFLRPIVLDSTSGDALVQPAQALFAEHSRRRTAQMNMLRSNWKPAVPRRICLVAPSRFRLWDDTGFALATAISASDDGIDIRRFDPDDPASSSPLALADFACQCDAIVTPNMGRADLPNLLPDEMPWATWVTTPRIPAAAGAGIYDSLLLADSRWKPAAMNAGWDARRLFLAEWPTLAIPHQPDGRDDPLLAIISDTGPLDPPARITDFSSHRLLWEAIAEELLQNPFCIGESPETYLAHWMNRASVANEGFDRPLFLDGLIAHAYQQGLARLLKKEGIPFRLHGAGWERLSEISSYAAGPVSSRDVFTRIIGSAAGLIHVRPWSAVHPIGAICKPVVQEYYNARAFIRDARAALAGRLGTRPRSGGEMSRTFVVRALQNRDPEAGLHLLSAAK